MSRLGERKRSVVDEISSDQEDMNAFTRVTFTMKKKDIQQLDDYIRRANENSSERVTKSEMVRKALQMAYKEDRLFTKYLLSK
ncbi:MAG: hypothetical protein HQK96_08485 [Nitrospirae bacterium]|nr:hypothetical protein [Nitrospirota bacterium]MBF0554574.1 hypothetical protein [Nitrospirota bacterium]